MQSETTGSNRSRLAGLSLAALGVVYGDIGTSPLYAVKECFDPRHGLPLTPANTLGVLSLILWTLTLVVSVKYLLFVLRASNNGEGGILALLSLAVPETRSRTNRTPLNALIISLGVAGACLMYGDGVLTPAVP